MGSIWAVARNTISQAIRMKIAVVVVVMLGVLLPLMGIVMGGDGTLQGKLQTFASYGLSLTSLLMCIMTIAVSTYTFTDDIKRKQVFLVLTKPLRRYEFVLGKFLGVVILDVFLLAIFGAIIFGFTYSIPKFVEADEVQVTKANQAFFTSRAVMTDPIDGDTIRAKADKEFQRRLEEGEISRNNTIEKLKFLKQGILAEEIGKVTNIRPGATKAWTFKNVRPTNPDDILFVQYKLEPVTPGVEKLYTQWRVGDIGRSAIGDQKTQVGGYNSRDVVRITKEFRFPAEVIAEDGYVSVVFRNPFENRSIVVVEDVKLLYRAGTFAGNFLRVLGVVLARLVFLAALGVSVSTWLSFPVAILISLVVFLLGTVNGFIVESITGMTSDMFYLYKYTLRPLLWLLPVFDGEFNPTPYLVSGEFLKWSTLGRIFAITGFVKSALLILAGIFIFNRREIAKVTV